jgi:hypothetical protein
MLNKIQHNQAGTLAINFKLDSDGEMNPSVTFSLENAHVFPDQVISRYRKQYLQIPH